jgi:hypothetical protein
MCNKQSDGSIRTKHIAYEPIFVRSNCLGVIYALRGQVQPKHEKEFQNKLTSSVIYGIYKLKVSPDNFSSVVEYLEAVNKQIAKLITKDLLTSISKKWK